MAEASKVNAAGVMRERTKEKFMGDPVKNGRLKSMRQNHLGGFEDHISGHL
jgi:hypothetical protein